MIFTINLTNLMTMIGPSFSNIIKEFNLNIAIKPHPNSINEGNSTYIKLKQYSDLYWLNQHIK